jgi:hypothetical protein
MTVNVAMLAEGGIWEALINHLSEILKAASSSVWGVLALIVVAFAVIGALVLSSFGKSAKLAVFFGCGALLMFVLVFLRTASSWPDGPKPRPQQQVIAGRIVDASTDQGIPRITVLLEGAASPPPHDETDAYGNFNFSGLAVSDVSALRLSLTTTEYDPTSWRLSPADPLGSLRISVRKVASAVRGTAPVAPPGVRRIAGKVIDGATKSPIAQAKVELRGLVSPAPEKNTDTRGNFVFDIPGSQDKSATPHLFVSVPGYSTFDCLLSPGENWKDLDIRLEKERGDK